MSNHNPELDQRTQLLEKRRHHKKRDLVAAAIAIAMGVTGTIGANSAEASNDEDPFDIYLRSISEAKEANEKGPGETGDPVRDERMNDLLLNGQKIGEVVDLATATMTGGTGPGTPPPSEFDAPMEARRRENTQPINMTLMEYSFRDEEMRAGLEEVRESGRPVPEYSNEYITVYAYDFNDPTRPFPDTDVEIFFGKPDSDIPEERGINPEWRDKLEVLYVIKEENRFNPGQGLYVGIVLRATQDIESDGVTITAGSLMALDGDKRTFIIAYNEENDPSVTDPFVPTILEINAKVMDELLAIVVDEEQKAYIKRMYVGLQIAAVSQRPDGGFRLIGEDIMTDAQGNEGYPIIQFATSGTETGDGQANNYDPFTYVVETKPAPTPSPRDVLAGGVGRVPEGPVSDAEGNWVDLTPEQRANVPIKPFLQEWINENPSVERLGSNPIFVNLDQEGEGKEWANALHSNGIDIYQHNDPEIQRFNNEILPQLINELKGGPVNVNTPNGIQTIDFSTMPTPQIGVDYLSSSFIDSHRNEYPSRATAFGYIHIYYDLQGSVLFTIELEDDGQYLGSRLSSEAISAMLTGLASESNRMSIYQDNMQYTSMELIDDTGNKVMSTGIFTTNPENDFKLSGNYQVRPFN